MDGARQDAFRLWEGGPLFRQAEHVRLTTDSVLLADFARVRAGTRGADLGCASGALMLLLLWREATLSMTGFELLPDAAALAEENLRVNGLDRRGEVLIGDMRETGKLRPNGGYDFVISNPPYFTQDRGVRAPNRDRAAARDEGNCSLSELCRVAARLCRGGGKCFFSYRSERLRELLAEMNVCHLEPKILRFVHHSAERDASLVLVEGRKDSRPGIAVMPPLILFSEDGKETAEYKRIYHRM